MDISKALPAAILLIMTLSHNVFATQEDELLIDAKQVLILKNELSTKISTCKAKLPARSSYLDFYEYIWNKTNYMEITAATTIYEAQPEDRHFALVLSIFSKASKFSQHYKAQNTATQISLCNSFLAETRKTPIELNTELPKESEALRKQFIGSEKQPNFLRDNDLKIGCVKSYYNRGLRDLALADSICNCTIDTVLGLGTTDEIDEWLNNEDKTKILNKPWAKDLVQKVQHCTPST